MIYLLYVINSTFARFFFFDPRKYNWIELKGYSRLKKSTCSLSVGLPQQAFDFKHEIITGSYKI